MPLIVQYLLKLSLSLALVYLLYQLLLRRLTFYNCNRFYLLGYTALCFIIPLINITPALEAGKWENKNIASVIPAWQLTTSNKLVCDPVELAASSANGYWNILLYGLLAGSIILVAVFCVRYLSFMRIRSQARLLTREGLRIYQVDKNIMPFSFGNAVFINHTLHGEDELREIIRHEFVHVKQRHSVDILWAELLCMLNWYNPFVWMLRKSIRQNLEFIADEQVVKSGLDKKHYQYLLLKVIGNNHFSIANQFNFSSLKKRIAMMNKNQTSKRHLLRLLLILPAVAILLLAFRQKSIGNDTIPVTRQPIVSATDNPVKAPGTADQPAVAGTPAAMDARPAYEGVISPDVALALDTVPFVNEKGYSITVTDTKGNCTVVVKDKEQKLVKKILLTDWNKNKAHYDDLYGEVPPPPPAPAAPATPAAPAVALAKEGPPFSAKESFPTPPAPPSAPAPATFSAIPAPASAPHPVAAPPTPPVAPKAPKFPENVTGMHVMNNKATVTLKDGKKETYDLNDAKQKAAFEKKYGELPEPPEPPEPAISTGTQDMSLDMTFKQSTGEKSFIKRHPKVERIGWGRVEQVDIAPSFASTTTLPAMKKGDVFITITFKNGKWDMYNLGNSSDVERFKKNYGEEPPSSPFEGC